MPSEAATAELIHSIYAALAAREIEAVQPFLDDQLLVEEMRGSDCIALGRGLEGLVRFLDRYDGQFREFRFEPLEVVAIAEQALVKVRFGGVGISGAEQWGTGYHLHTLARGRLTRLQLFAERNEAARAAGLAEAG